MSLKFGPVVLMAICGILFGSFSEADENANENRHVVVGTRAEPFEKQIMRLKTREKKETSEEAHGKNKTEKRKKTHGKAKEDVQEDVKLQEDVKDEPQDAMALTLAKKMYVTTHPAAYQSLVALSFYGDTIELMDGSIWAVSPYESYKLANWFPSDAIVISPNQDWFSSYSFRLLNQNTSESVATNLYLGPIDPIYNSPYTLWIAGIDYGYNIVYLSDGSIWDMSLLDLCVVNEWMVGDVVIIGVNTGRLSTFNPNILINVNTLNYAAGAVSY